MMLSMSYKKAEQYEQEKAQLFRVIIGQCKLVLKTKVESLPKFKEMDEADDVLGLLGLIETQVYNTDNVQYDYWTMQATMRTLLSMRQKPKELLGEFAKRFLAQQEMTERIWGKLVPSKMKGKNSDVQDKSRLQFLACVFLAGVDRGQYKVVIDDLNNEFLMGKQCYPGDVQGMVNLLNNRRGDDRNNSQVDAMNDGVMVTSFNQTEERRKCFICKEAGHIASNCPKKKKKKKSGASMLQDESENAEAPAPAPRARVGWSGLQF
jgi:hypothetical protein